MRGRSKTDCPAAEGRQQMMMHLDIAVEDLAPAVACALDPADHPFCLYLDK